MSDQSLFAVVRVIRKLPLFNWNTLTADSSATMRMVEVVASKGSEGLSVRIPSKEEVSDPYDRQFEISRITLLRLRAWSTE